MSGSAGGLGCCSAGFSFVFSVLVFSSGSDGGIICVHIIWLHPWLLHGISLFVPAKRHLLDISGFSIVLNSSIISFAFTICPFCISIMVGSVSFFCMWKLAVFSFSSSNLILYSPAFFSSNNWIVSALLVSSVVQFVW